METNAFASVPILTRQTRPGRPSKLTPRVIGVILQAIEAGSYYKPACEAAGVSYQTVRNWILRGQREQEEGKFTEYVGFLDLLTRANAVAECAMVERISQAAEDDWRAAAWLLERRYPERWGRKGEQQRAADVVLVLSDKQQETVVELRKIANARKVIDTTSTPSPPPPDDPTHT